MNDENPVAASPLVSGTSELSVTSAIAYARAFALIRSWTKKADLHMANRLFNSKLWTLNSTT